MKKGRRTILKGSPTLKIAEKKEGWIGPVGISPMQERKIEGKNGSGRFGNASKRKKLKREKRSIKRRDHK